MSHNPSEHTQHHNTPLLYALLELSGMRPLIYDMGRRVVELPRQDFIRFETTEQPYPYPLQQHACFALVLNENSPQQEPVIWFLRLPLDEQGKLVQASRDYLVRRLLEQAASDEAKDPLRDNPFTFAPPTARMASLHAKLARELGKPPSSFYSAARDYLQGRFPAQHWPAIGYQGIADLAARLDQDDNEALVLGALSWLPSTPLHSLCHCLEHESLSPALANGLLQRLEEEILSNDDTLTLSALARGLSYCDEAPVRTRAIDLLLSNPRLARQIEVLATLCGRLWRDLGEPERMAHLLEALADNDAGQQGFDQCLSDLLFLPDMRPKVMAVLRSPHRSDRLAQAFQVMTQGSTSQGAGKVTLH